MYGFGESRRRFGFMYFEVCGREGEGLVDVRVFDLDRIASEGIFGWNVRIFFNFYFFLFNFILFIKN